MKHALFAVFLLALVPVYAGAAEFKSHFGFPFSLGDDWIVLTPENVATPYGKKSLETFRHAAPNMAEHVEAKVKGGTIEFYIDGKHLAGGVGSISTQLAQSAGAPTPATAKATCGVLAKKLEETEGEPVKVTECGYAKTNGVPYIAYTYSVPLEGKTILIREIPYVMGIEFDVTAASRNATLSTTQAGTDRVVDAITKHIHAQWHAKAPSEKQRISLVQESMHRFALAMNAKDCTEFYKGISRLWQQQTSAQALDKMYKGFMDSGIDLLPLDKIKPNVEMVREKDDPAVLVLKGEYPLKGVKVTFTFDYIHEAPAWKLVGMNVNVRSAR